MLFKIVVEFSVLDRWSILHQFVHNQWKKYGRIVYSLYLPKPKLSLNTKSGCVCINNKKRNIDENAIYLTALIQR